MKINKMTRNDWYTVRGGEQVKITGEEAGRLIVEGKKLFFANDDSAKRPIAPEDILCICITNVWFGVLPSRGLKFLRDAIIYSPRKMDSVA